MICKTSFLSLVGISEPHNEGDTSIGMCHNRWMDAHLHFDDMSGRRIHAVLVFDLSFLPSSVTEIFAYDADVHTLAQHSITNSFRTLLYFILLDQFISATTSIFSNHFSITKQIVQPISI